MSNIFNIFQLFVFLAQKGLTIFENVLRSYNTFFNMWKKCQVSSYNIFGVSRRSSEIAPQWMSSTITGPLKLYVYIKIYPVEMARQNVSIKKCVR